MHWILGFSLFLPLLLCAENPDEIQSLNDQLKKNRLQEMDEYVEGQWQMMEDWPAYRQDLEKIKQQKEEDRNVENKIEKMEQQKPHQGNS